MPSFELYWKKLTLLCPFQQIGVQLSVVVVLDQYVGSLEQSTATLRNIVLSLTYPLAIRSVSIATKRGQPEAMFISDDGLWKDEELGSGMNVSEM